MKLVLALFLVLSSAGHAKENEDARLAIHLLDYMASDYSGAVENGKIKSKTEYEEQMEFSSKVVNIISSFHQATITEKSQNLKQLILKKKSASEIALLARAVQRELLTYSKISFSPEVWPSLKKGAALYKANCLNCHGAEGFGNGADAKGLIPPPADFHRMERMNKISAFHCYNTIRLGVPGTAMVAFDKLDDKDIWNLAFYIMSIPYITQSISEVKTSINLSLNEMSILSNNEMKEKFSVKDDNQIIALRTTEHLSSSEEYLQIAQVNLAEVLQHYLHGDKNAAKQYAIQSYLQGIEPIEPAIKANKPELLLALETSMGEIRKLSELADKEKELETEINKTEKLFQDVKQTLNENKLSFSVAMFGSFAIVLREGLEAVLLLVTLLSVVGAMKNKKAVRYIHYGWTSALIIGFIMWFISGALINVSGVGREMLEACTALLAIVVLLYFGFWLHQKTEITRWKIFIDEKINSAIADKNLFTLFSIAFMAVFREAFETVLFIRSLWFQTADNDKHAIPLGLILSFVVIAIASFLMLRFSKKLQMRKLFQVSSLLMSLLAIVLTGKAIHSFQEIGVLPIHSIPLNFRLDILGVFPVWEGILTQVILTIAIYFMLNGKNLKKI